MPMRSPAQLPDDVIDRLFSALTVRYGAPFLDRWRDLDLAVVKGDWARELSGFAGNLEALRYALDHLPDKPPNVIEFRKIANGGPAPTVPEDRRIECSAAGKERIAAELEKLAPVIAGAGRVDDGKEWARRIIANDAAGIRSRSSLPLKMARAALGAA